MKESNPVLILHATDLELLEAKVIQAYDKGYLLHGTMVIENKTKSLHGVPITYTFRYIQYMKR